jgi:hypothetical protein
MRPPHLCFATIDVAGRPLREITDDALAALVAENSPPAVFVRRGALVRVRRDEHGRPFVESLTETVLRHRLARVADFVRTAKDGKTRHISPPRDVTADVLALATWPDLPTLEAVTEVPVFRPDGSLLDTPGYDASTRLVYCPTPRLQIPCIPVAPSAADVRAAAATVLDLFGDFPFTSPASLANTMGLLLTPVVRPVLNGPTPLALIDKPKRGTGATLIAQIVQAIATGKLTELMTAPHDDDEWRKKITAALAAGMTVLFFDNVEHKLSSASLAAALTAPEWSDRLLGHSEIISAPNRATWIATGNNLRLGGDIARRCYWIRVDSKVARPWQRAGFRHPRLLHHVLTHRGAILGSLLTLVRGWFVAGRPVVDTPKLGGFEDWTETVGGILAFSGISGFLENTSDLYDRADDEETAWIAFLMAWRARYADRALTVAEVTADLREGAPELREALPGDLADALQLDGRGTSFTRRLGTALAKREGAVFESVLLRRAGEAQRAIKWQVVPAAQASESCESRESLAVAVEFESGSNGNGERPKQTHGTHQTHIGKAPPDPLPPGWAGL